MPSIDRRNAANHQSGGSDIDIEVYLTDEEAALYMDAGDTAGWYQKFTTRKGSIDTPGEITERKRENGEVIGSTGKEDIVREFECYETDAKTVLLVNRCLRRTPHKYRYKIPFGDGYQVWGIRNALVTNSFGFETDDEVDRVPTVQVTGRATTTVEAYEVAEVADVADQAGWPAELADFKDAAV